MSSDNLIKHNNTITWAILTPVKNEPKLKEWILYHSTFLKPTLFVIIDDHSLVSPEKDFHEIGVTNYEIIKHTTPQWINDVRHWNLRSQSWKPYVKDILEKHNIDYVLPLDADEFLYLNHFSSMSELVKYYAPFDMLKIHWSLFLNDGTQKEETDISGYIESYDKSFESLNYWWKVLTRVKSIKGGNSAHCFLLNNPKESIVKDLRNINLGVYDGLGTSLPIESQKVKDAPMWINHYMFRSIQTTVKKRFAARYGCFDNIWGPVPVIKNNCITYDTVLNFHRDQETDVVDYIEAILKEKYCDEFEKQIYKKTQETLEEKFPLLKKFRIIYTNYFFCIQHGHYENSISGCKTETNKHMKEFVSNYGFQDKCLKFYCNDLKKEIRLLKNKFNEDKENIKFWTFDSIISTFTPGGPDETLYRFGFNVDTLFGSRYGRLCNFSGDGIWELCQYKDLIYVYMKRPYTYKKLTYYDLISPYGYNGFYYEKAETFKEFIPLFRNIAKNRNFITEVVKQAPYLNLDTSIIDDVYGIITDRRIFSVKLDTCFEDYKQALTGKQRNMLNKAEKLKFSYKTFSFEKNEIEELIPVWDRFKKLYHETMSSLKADSYYYFNDQYFQDLMVFKKTHLFVIYNKEKEEIGYSIVVKSSSRIHYHLSCSNKSENCISNYIIASILKEFNSESEKYEFVLGGGLKDNDSLYRFKQKVSTNYYNYKIYKNILNEEVYNKINEGIEEDYFPIHKKPENKEEKNNE